MSQTPIDLALRARIDSFIDEITELVRRAAVEKVEDALRGELGASATRSPARRRERIVELQPQAAPKSSASSRPRPQSPTGGPTAPVSLEGYERLAIVRALAESGGDAHAAARTLRMGKSSIYRRMKALDIPLPRQGLVTTPEPGDPLVGSKEPLSLASYEKAAISRALDECGGSKLAAARLLRVGKSTLYRLAQKHRIA